MSTWYESIVDRQIREAQEQGGSAVRAFVDALNAKIRHARMGLLDGPATVLATVNVDEVLRGWRRRRRRR